MRLAHPGGVKSYSPDPLLSHAIGPFNSLTGWLAQVMKEPAGNRGPETGNWENLLGLGPGLTPSGDDLVGGVMIALHRLGLRSCLVPLASAVSEVLDARTGPISAAHLKAAMEGMGSEAVHRAMEAILANNGEAIEGGLAQIDSVGHSSGWDTMAGIAAVIRLWLGNKGMRSKRPSGGFLNQTH